MKLLFILNHTDLTGVNTFVFTVVSAIKKKYDYDVDVYLPSNEGILYKELSKMCNVVSEIKGEYEIVYFNYENSEFYDSVKGEKRFFVHGLMSANNIPTRKYSKVYCFGERSLNYIQAENKVLIRNYIDCERFRFIEPSGYPERILIHSSRDSQILLTPIITAASYLDSFVSFSGADFLNRGKVWDVVNKIKFSDLVVGYGRCLLEAMAMGKAALLFGVNGGSGLISSNNFWTNAETNFSGWIDRKIEFDLSDKCVNALLNEINRYSKKDIYSNYEIIREHFDINKKIDTLI